MLVTEGGAVRFSNTSELDVYSGEGAGAALPIYSQAVPAPEVEHVRAAEAFEESLFLGLRLNAGVSLGALRERFGEAMVDASVASIREVVDAGLLEWRGDRVALTDRGRIVSNEVFSRLLLDVLTPV